MNDYIKEITLDINCEKSPIKIFAGQYDIGRKFIITVTADGNDFSCSGCSVVCQGVRGNGTHFSFECTVNSNGKIEADLKLAFCSNGISIVKFVISDSTRSYSTQTFIIDVDSALLGNISTVDDYLTLNQLLEKVHELTDSGAILVDTELSSNSDNPVSNNVIYAALLGKQKVQYITDTITTIDDLIALNDVNTVYNGVMSGFSTTFGQNTDTTYTGFRMWFVQMSPKQAISFYRIISLYDGTVWFAYSKSRTDFYQIAYTKKQVDNFLNAKADKTEVDSSLATKADNTTVVSISEGLTTFALYSDFVQAGTKSTDGSLNTDVKYRVTSEDIMQFDYDLNVTVDEGFTGYVVKYVDGSYESVYSLGNAKYNYVIPAGTEFRLHIRRAVEDTTETANISEFVNAVKFQTKTAAEVAKKANKAEATETKEAINDLKAYIGYDDEDIARIQVDYQNKTFKRLAGACDKSAGTDFDSFPMFGGRKRCNVSDDGTIVAYYGDADYAEDGSNGQVMTYQPAFYYKVDPLVYDKNTVSGIGYHLRKANYYVSSKPKTGFKLHPAFYDINDNAVDYILLSAYEGSMYDTSAAAYVNDGTDTDTAIETDDLLCSVAGKKPISGKYKPLTKANLETLAGNRGIGWHLETIKATSANQLLMMIELGSMNTQTSIGQGIVSITDNSAYNCSSLTGSTAELGNATGEATATINEIGGTETVYTTSGKLAVTYRGVENPWGNIWKHINGINIWGDGTMGGGQPYIANDFSFNESKHTDNYKAAGFTLTNENGYINAMGYGGEDYDWLFFHQK